MFWPRGRDSWLGEHERDFSRTGKDISESGDGRIISGKAHIAVKGRDITREDISAVVTVVAGALVVTIEDTEVVLGICQEGDPVSSASTNLSQPLPSWSHLGDS